MNVRVVLICAIFVLQIFAGNDARRTSGRRGGGGWGLGYGASRVTPRTAPRQRPTGSSPDKIGWNIPESNKKQSPPPRASAPVPEQSSKTSATNVQSGYNPSGGYPRQPATNPQYGGANSNPSQYSGAGAHPPPYSPSGAHPPAYSPPGVHPPPYSPPGVHPPAYSPPGVHPPAYHSPVGAPPAYSPAGQVYNPSMGGHVPSYGQPSFGQSYNPGGYNPGGFNPMPQQTILLQPGQSSRPGIGQLAKEAFVFAGVSAGVNAAVNRIIPGGIYGTRGTGGGGGGNGGGTTHTEITYNNYYNNGTAPDQAAAANPAPNQTPAASNQTPNQAAAPEANQNSQAGQTSQTDAANSGAPAAAAAAADAKPNSQEAAQNNPNPLGYVVSNDDIKKLTEELFTKDKNNAFKYITVNLQGEKKDESTTDDAPEPLLKVQDEAYEIPTIKAVLALHDNYELDVRKKEVVTPEERKEESELLDKFLETDVLSTTMKFLASKGYIEDDAYEFKDTLKRIWFSQFKRIDGDASSSAFETVYLAEQFDSDIIGLHNWIYYAKMEAEKLNYLGYLSKLDFGDKGMLLKVRSSLNSIVQPATVITVGTSPELEFALYTMCFFVRPNGLCPIHVGGQSFSIIANRVNYFGKDIMISAFPDF
ncbi:hypothetical protein KM043_018160 [Ampulex compressa]|nr:hypothetical protein KM043_018160 [Ampulex compressa]